MNQYRCETCEYYPAGSIFDERCPYSEFTWRHAGNHPQCIKDPFLASDIWQVPIDVMSELTSFIGCVSHSDLQYQCGDNCKGECSGEVDGFIHCPEEEHDKEVRKKVLDELVSMLIESCSESYEPNGMGCKCCPFLIVYDEGLQCAVKELRQAGE